MLLRADDPLVQAGYVPQRSFINSHTGYRLEYPPVSAEETRQPVTDGITEIDCQDFYSVPADRNGLYRLVHD